MIFKLISIYALTKDRTINSLLLRLIEAIKLLLFKLTGGKIFNGSIYLDDNMDIINCCVKDGISGSHIVSNFIAAGNISKAIEAADLMNKEDFDDNVGILRYERCVFTILESLPANSALKSKFLHTLDLICVKAFLAGNVEKSERIFRVCKSNCVN